MTAARSIARAPASTGELYEEFPAYGSVLLKLAKTNLRTVQVCYFRRVAEARSFLPRSACRHAARIISSRVLRGSGVWSLRVLEPSALRSGRAFPADCPHRSNCHCRVLRAHERAWRRVSADTPGVPAYSQICSRNYSGQPIVTAAVYRGFGSQLRLAANRLR